MQNNLNNNLLRGIMECKDFIFYTVTIIAALTLVRWGWQTRKDSRRQRRATTDKNHQYYHNKSKFFSGWVKHHNSLWHQAGMSCCSEEFPCNTSCGGHNAQSCAACPQVIWLSSVLQILSFALDLMLMLKILGLRLWKFILPFTSGSWCEVVQWRLWLEGWQMPATCWDFRYFIWFLTFLFDGPPSKAVSLLTPFIQIHQAPAARRGPCALTKSSTPSAQNMTVVSTQQCLAGLVRFLQLLGESPDLSFTFRLGLIHLLTTTAREALGWKETTAATRQNTLGAFGENDR